MTGRRCRVLERHEVGDQSSRMEINFIGRTFLRDSRSEEVVSEAPTSYRNSC